jgi:hypothetical protein
MIKLNRAQKTALACKWRQNNQSMSYLAFRRTAHYDYMMNCLMVQWSGMWLGIETDGHTHS